MKKLVSVLLALTLCSSLVVSAFAGPAEEIEILPIEEAQALPELTTEEGELVEEVRTVINIHNHCIENFDWEKMKEGTTIVQCSNCFCCNSFNPTLEMEVAMPSVTAQDELGNCDNCGKSNWGNGDSADPYYINKEGLTHTEVTIVTYLCKTPECRMAGIARNVLNKKTYYHDYWKKGSLKEAQSVDGSTHKATYNYSCVCGKTTTKSETESHSLQKGAFTGNHYHVEGSVKHMAEYRYTCSGCGYSTTKWEYYICPGGSGGGCLYPTSLDEEELMGGVTGPEDAALPEDVVLPEDVTTPGDAMEPDETDAPGEIATPEETTGPEDQYE